MTYWLQALFWIVISAALGLAVRPLINRTHGGRR